jgi:hypothetical protein
MLKYSGSVARVDRRYTASILKASLNNQLKKKQKSIYVLQFGQHTIYYRFSFRDFPYMALGSTQPLTETSTRNFPGGKGRPARKADNLTATCEPIV